VSEVLGATLRELAEGGLETLRVERVAERAGVNKTSIYRRWPTRGHLVSAALRQVAVEFDPPPETGDVRKDVLHMFRRMMAPSRAQKVQALSRVMHLLNEKPMEPEVTRTVDELRMQMRTRWTGVLERAVERGALVTDQAPEFLMELITSALMVRHKRNGRVTDHYMCQVVDFVLEGAVRRQARPARATRVGAPRPISA
jgi:AcrR family transcriptional regulator